MAGLIKAGDLRDFIRIERPVIDEDFDAAGSGSWELVDEVWAQVQDVLPSRGERLADGINIATQPARVRMWWRDDVTAAMRLVLDERVMQIVAGPAKIDNGKGLEVMVENYSTAGSGA